MKKRSLECWRGHRALLLNWFRAKGQLSSGLVEGFNTQAKQIMMVAETTFRRLNVADLISDVYQGAK